MSDHLLSSLADGLEAMQLPMSSAQQQCLLDYVLLIDKWNRVYNLTAVKTPAEMITRHLLDSLSISAFLKGDSILDIGAGAGLPGIPLAISHPALSVTLVDRVQKKWRFMTFAAGTLGLANVSVEHKRIEQLEAPQGFAMITARAFAEVDVLCRLSARLLRPDGRVLAMIGKPLNDEQMERLRAVEGFSPPEIHKLCVPGEQGDRNLVILTRR